MVSPGMLSESKHTVDVTQGYECVRSAGGDGLKDCKVEKNKQTHKQDCKFTAANWLILVPVI